jgi:hypothetical protein
MTEGKIDNLSEMKIIIVLEGKLNKIMYIKCQMRAQHSGISSVSFLSLPTSTLHERLISNFTDFFFRSFKGIRLYGSINVCYLSFHEIFSSILSSFLISRTS